MQAANTDICNCLVMELSVVRRRDVNDVVELLQILCVGQASLPDIIKCCLFLV